MNRRTGTLLAAVLGSGIVFLDSTVVNVALQKIGEDLPSSFFGVLEGQSYIYNAYLLSLSALLILAGALADAYGRRRLFVIGLVGFGVASVLCGFAPNIETLIFFRIIQGAAGALLVPGSLALITHTFEGAERGRAIGIWAAAAAATAILGPFVGGTLVQTDLVASGVLPERALIAIALWASWRYVVESRDPDAARSFDWLGALVVALAVGGLAFGAIYGQQHEWQDAVGPLALAVGARRHRALRDPDGPRQASAGAAGPVPVAQLRRDEPLDLPDLRRPVRHRLPAIHLQPGHARLLGRRRRLDRPARRSDAGPALVARRVARRPARAAPVHGGRPGR